MTRNVAIITAAIALSVSAYVGFLGRYDEVMVEMRNERAGSVVVQITAPIDRYGLFPADAAFLMHSGGVGPYLEAQPGTKVLLFDESCGPLGEIVLPTWGFGDPAYTIHADGSVTSQTVGPFGDAISSRVADHEPCL